MFKKEKVEEIISKFKLNKKLIENKKISEENILKMGYFYSLLFNILDEAYDLKEIKTLLSKKEFKKEARRLGKLLDKVEGKIQKLWGFETDESKYKFWNRLAVCDCPVFDNAESFGVQRIISCGCPAHKHLCKEDKRGK